MHVPHGPIWATLARFRSDERGAITVESVLWMPIYMLFFALIADVSMMFHSQAKVTRIVQDANRLASFQILEDADAVENNVKARLAPFSKNASVETTLGSGAVATTVTMPVTDVAIIGFVGKLLEFDITVSSMHLVES
ncbi:TadE/TadG family type IV pilus assembly protein [Kangsaoukella pontilimi]|uniref:TadE/TadG family type IV pilus assembly protein n=1 Tax=Kangsaoukella pontilimi TaxID=2691042 RepID=UPI001D0AA940|nr:TadE/TadG family type IV pilus assembly protein [Kangsaoukella pontilimi]